MPFSSDALNVGVCGPLLRAAIQFDFLIVAFQVPIQQPSPMRASISCRFLCAGSCSYGIPGIQWLPSLPRQRVALEAEFNDDDASLTSAAHLIYQKLRKEKNKAESWRKWQRQKRKSLPCERANKKCDQVSVPFRGPPNQTLRQGWGHVYDSEFIAIDIAAHSGKWLKPFHWLFFLNSRCSVHVCIFSLPNKL